MNDVQEFDSVGGYVSDEPTTINPVTYNENKVPELTFGEKLVGITFNLSNDDKVHKLKSLFAEAANIIVQEMSDRVDKSPTTEESYFLDLIGKQAIGGILEAQMLAVKLVTLKY